MLFNNALFGIRRQGGKSFFEGIPENELGTSTQSFWLSTARCLYRGPNNRRCAVGWNLYDYEYDPDMEEMLLRDVLPKRLIPYLQFLRRLQVIHDKAGYVNDILKNGCLRMTSSSDEIFLQQFEKGMKSFAQEHNLRYAPPTSSEIIEVREEAYETCL